MGDARSNWLGGLRGTKLRRVFFFFFSWTMLWWEKWNISIWYDDYLIHHLLFTSIWLCLLFVWSLVRIRTILRIFSWLRDSYSSKIKLWWVKKKLFHFIWQLSKHILRIKFLDFDPGIRSSLDCKAFTFATQAIPTLVCNVGRPSRVRAECCSTAMQEQPQESSMICSNYSMHLCTHICIYILK